MQRGADPVIYFEPKRLYRAVKGEVPTEDYTVELGRAAHERVLSVRRRSLALGELRLLLGLEPSEAPRLAEAARGAESPPEVRMASGQGRFEHA